MPGEILLFIVGASTEPIRTSIIPVPAVRKGYYRQLTVLWTGPKHPTVMVTAALSKRRQAWKLLFYIRLRVGQFHGVIRYAHPLGSRKLYEYTGWQYAEQCRGWTGGAIALQRASGPRGG